MNSQEYKEKKTEQRRLLRKNKTKSEAIVWKLLRNRETGYKFRRQYSIGRYIVDFYCPEQKLIVEIDGSSHEGVYEQDKLREEFLIKNGYRVIRYKNEMVLNNPDAVKDDIIKLCKL